MQRRWYDQEPACEPLLQQLSSIQSGEIREFCARMIIHFTERIRALLEPNGAPRSLGLPALQDRFLARQERRRWYDPDPVLQKAIGGLYSLPPEGLSALSFRLGDTLGLIALYDYVCERLQQAPVTEELVEITQASLQAGQEEAQEVLQEIIGKDLFKALAKDFSR